LPSLILLTFKWWTTCAKQTSKQFHSLLQGHHPDGTWLLNLNRTDWGKINITEEDLMVAFDMRSVGCFISWDLRFQTILCLVCLESQISGNASEKYHVNLVYI
jgi:hypothetical protein